MRFGIIVFLVVFISMAQKCKDEAYVTAKGEIIQISAPDTVMLGSTFKVFVEFSGGTNGCAKAVRLDLELEEQQGVITPYYRIPTDPELKCTMAIPVHELETELSVVTKGSFTLRSTEGSVVKVVEVIAPPNE